MHTNEKTAGNLLPVSVRDVGGWVPPVFWCVERDVAESDRGVAEKCAESLDHGQI